MTQRTRIIASLVSGAAALALSFLYVAGVQAQAAQAQQETLARYGGDLVQVCVATRDIAAGEQVDDSCVSVQEWVASLLPQESFTALRDLEGKTAASRIPKNAVVCGEYFKTNGQTLEVPEGKAAVSVAADEVHAVGGVLAIDDHVDLYVSKDGVANRLCGARVIGTSSEDGGGSLEWVTLAIDSENVNDVLAATANGTISLIVPAGLAGEEGDAS